MPSNPKKVFVGNVAYEASERELCDLFSKIGRVEEVVMLPRGCAFLCLSSPEAAAQAIAKLNGYELHGRPLRVSEARPQARW